MEPKVQASSIFRTGAERAFDLFADAQSMSRFWFHRRDDGLAEGKRVTWYMSADPDSPSFPVTVMECRRPERLAIEWGEGVDRATVTWTFEAKGKDRTLVRIEETGHALSGDALTARLLDSTGGFNQVLIAAKALAEHDVDLNVVKDHA